MGRDAWNSWIIKYLKFNRKNFKCMLIFVCLSRQLGKWEFPVLILLSLSNEKQSTQNNTFFVCVWKKFPSC